MLGAQIRPRSGDRKARAGTELRSPAPNRGSTKRTGGLSQGRPPFRQTWDRKASRIPTSDALLDKQDRLRTRRASGRQSGGGDGAGAAARAPAGAREHVWTTPAGPGSGFEPSGEHWAFQMRHLTSRAGLSVSSGTRASRRCLCSAPGSCAG